MNKYKIHQYIGSKIIRHPESILTEDKINEMIKIIDHCIYPKEISWDNDLYHSPYRGYDSLNFYIHFSKFQGYKAESLFNTLDAVNLSDYVLDGSNLGYICRIENAGDSGMIRVYIYRGKYGNLSS